MRRPEGTEVLEVGPHPKGLLVRAEETDPPPEDPKNVAEASRVTILWMMSRTVSSGWKRDLTHYKLLLGGSSGPP